jgi:hypothetical protein
VGIAIALMAMLIGNYMGGKLVFKHKVGMERWGWVLDVSVEMPFNCVLSRRHQYFVEDF